MATFRRCMKNFEKVPDVYNYYGELLLDQQKYQEAVEKFDRAVEMEQKERITGMNVLPLINKALALFQWKQDFTTAEELCQKALISMFSCPLLSLLRLQLLTLSFSRPRVRHCRRDYGPASTPTRQGHRRPDVLRARRRALPHRRRDRQRSFLRRGYQDTTRSTFSMTLFTVLVHC